MSKDAKIGRDLLKINGHIYGSSKWPNFKDFLMVGGKFVLPAIQINVCKISRLFFKFKLGKFPKL